MRHLLLGAAVVGIVWAIPAEAFPLAMPGVDSPNVETTLVTKVGWRRQHWRYGYRGPYASTLQVMGTTRLPAHTHIIRPHAATMCLSPRVATIP